MEVGNSRLDELVEEWIRAKYHRSNSQRTAQAYQETMARFRFDLARVNLDLLSPAEEIRRAAQIWLDHSQHRDRPDRPISAGTFNQRRAILSSFYRYAIRAGACVENPMARIDRRHAEPQRDPDPLTVQRLRYRLQSIDRTTATGRRDYALIELAVFSGKRDHELRSLNLGDLALRENGILITWQHQKGGKTDQKLYEFPHALSLLDYLTAQFGPDWQSYPDQALFVSLSYNAEHVLNGPRLTRNGIVFIYSSRLNTSRIHATRRLFAQILIEIGVSAPEVQRLMGHASLATTQRYFAARESTTNPHLGEMARLINGKEQ